MQPSEPKYAHNNFYPCALRSVDHLCSVQFHMLKGKRVEVKRAKESFNSGRSVGSGGKGNHATPLGPFHPGPGKHNFIRVNFLKSDGS